MTTQISVKLIKRPTVKAAVLPRFPATVATEKFLKVMRANGVYTFDIDYTQLDPTAFSDPANTYVAVLDAVLGSYKVTTLSALISGTIGIEQHVTAPGPVTVLNNAGIVRVDQTVGAAITLDMPLSSAKTCPVLIQDWKADSDVNNISVVLAGSDKFPGGLTTWTIAAQGASLRLSPVPGVGYVIG